MQVLKVNYDKAGYFTLLKNLLKFTFTNQFLILAWQFI